MSKEKILLVIASILILLGLFKPNLDNFITVIKPSVIADSFVVDKPTDEKVLELCNNIVDILRQGPTSDKKDIMRLSRLYYDMATLVSLDGDIKTISRTEDIRQANQIAGPMLGLKLKNKYEGLSAAADELIKFMIGSENVTLSDDLRLKSSEAFLALSWSFLEGSK
jgi:hypothetical protein